MDRIASALALVILLASAAWAEPLLVSPGEPAPEAGVLYVGEDLTKLVEALRDRETWKAQVEVFRGQVQAFEESLAASRSENAELKAALEAQKLALAKAEVLEQNWDRILGRYEDLLNKLDAYADQLEKRVSSLERQRNLAMLGGPILGIIFLILGLL